MRKRIFAMLLAALLCMGTALAEDCSSGHDWDAATYTWSADHSSCTATRVCRRNSSHVETASAKVTKNTRQPSCEEKGRTTYTATFSVNWAATQTVRQSINKFGHWYSAWVYIGANTHSALCKRSFCRDGLMVGCERYACTIQSSGEEYSFTICPICGAVNSKARLTQRDGASAAAMTFSVPKGDLVVRTGTLENGEKLMTICFEIVGVSARAKGTIRFSMPESLLEGCDLRLLHSDGTEAAVPVTVKMGYASFKLDFGAKDAASVMVLHMVPAKSSD